MCIRDRKNSIPDNVDVVMLRYHTAFDEEGKPVFSYYRERLIRKGTVSFWKGRVHEVIVHTGRVMYSEVAVTHRSVKTGYNDRNLRIYEKQEKAGAVSYKHLDVYKRQVPPEDLIVSGLVAAAEEICKETVRYDKSTYHAADRRIDRVLTGKRFGYPVMILLLAFILWLTITGANYPSQLLSDGLFWIQDLSLIHI